MSHRSAQFRLRHSRRHGAVLIVALIITIALAGVVLSLNRAMRVELQTAGNQMAALQADAVERGAEQYVLGMIASEADGVFELSEDQFQGNIGEGYFWILRPNYLDGAMPVFGLADESAKLNINSANYDQLMKLPGMTDELASDILGWRGEPRANSAGTEYYGALPDPYRVKEEAFETVEELLLVRGVTREVLYGDGTTGPLGEQPNGARAFNGNVLNDPMISVGLYDLLTIRNAQPNNGPAGSPRININQLQEQGGGGGGGGGGGRGGQGQQQGARRTLRTLLQQEFSATRGDEILANVVTRSNYRNIFDFYQQSQMTPDEFDQIADHLTNTNRLRATVNVNRAPAAVLACLSGLDSTDADALIAARPANPVPGQLAWFAETLGKEKAAAVAAQGNRLTITSRTYQFSADILAVSGNGRAFKRCRVIYDTRNGTPQVVYRRELTDRGWPMDPSILASIRAGQRFNGGNSGFAGGMFR